MGKTARAVHWTGHRHSARVPCPGAAGCVTLRFVRGFSSAVYAAGKDDPTVSAGGGNQEGGHPLFGVFPALRRDGGPRSAACFCRGHQESGLPRSGFGGGQQGKDRADQTSLWHLHECHTGTRTLPPDRGTELPAGRARRLGQLSCRSLQGNAHGYRLCPQRMRPERKRCGGTGDKR